MALVCLCHGVSERKVAKAISRGAHTVGEVSDACRAGTKCGDCVGTLSDMLAEQAASQTITQVALA